MNYTLHQLRIFVEVARSQSVTKASDKLHLTQPAVSLQLKKFQEQFDIALVEIINKRLFLTDFGKEIAEAAEKILNEVESIESKTHRYKGRLTGKFKIAVASTAKYVAPYLIAEFLRPNRGIELQLDVTNRTRVIASLQENSIDFGILSVLPEQPGFTHESIMENRLYLVGPGTDAPARKKMKINELDRLPLIYREEGSATRRMMETMLGGQVAFPARRIELSSNEAVKQAVMAGLGYSVMPLIGIRNELIGQELKIIPVEGLPVINNWYLVWHKDKELGPVAAAYVAFLRSNRERLVEENFGWIRGFLKQMELA